MTLWRDIRYGFRMLAASPGSTTIAVLSLAIGIGEIKAGRDPRRPRPVQKSSDAVPKDIADFLDAYVERCVRPAALKSMNSIGSRIAVLKEHLGDLPLEALEEPGEINRFKSQSAYAKRVELADDSSNTVNSARAEAGNHAIDVLIVDGADVWP